MMLRSLLPKVPVGRLFQVRGGTAYCSTLTVPALKLQPLDAGQKLRVIWEDGRTSDFHARWLRHNCRCPKCWNPSSHQKILSHHDLEGETVAVQSTELMESGDTVELKWWTTNGTEHKGQLDLNWLRNHDYSDETLNTLQQSSRPNTTGNLPTVSYSEIVSSEPHDLWDWLCALNDYGVCLLTGVPTENNKVQEVAEMIGPLVNTHYGTVFDVICQPHAINLAYTPNYLPLHVDLAYLESPPGIQLLHCLRNDPQVDGGDSILLDGWAIAESMRKRYPAYFKTLTEIPATFDKIQTGRVAIRHRKPHIVLDRDGEMVGFNWSPQNHGPLFIHEDEVEPYYKAYNVLARLLEESQDKLYHLLKPGDLLTFNNRRFLHSRNTFVANGGVRHLKGAYVSSDDFKSKVILEAERASPDHVVKAVMNGCSF